MVVLWNLLNFIRELFQSSVKITLGFCLEREIKLFVELKGFLKDLFRGSVENPLGLIWNV